MRFQPIYDIAELCARKGLKNAVLCPGSRCAPLTLAFAKHPEITTKIFPDERSAGFVALGMAQRLDKPTVLICTSGTAAYNFAPAVAEAFFGQIPLIVITADRPAEWINQHDGQTIYQSDIFGSHVKQSFQLPQTYDHPDDQWAINRILNDAINLSQQEPRGPVHINAPFREPLYPGKDESISFSKNVRVMDEEPLTESFDKIDFSALAKDFTSSSKILVVAGQSDFSETMIDYIQNFTKQCSTPVIGEIISNLHPIENLIKHADLFLSEISEETKKELQPDLLITFGKSVLSKNLKQFLRKFSPVSHWHICERGMVADTFQHLTKIIRTQPKVFFKSFKKNIPEKTTEAQRRYSSRWNEEEKKSSQLVKEYFQSKSESGEFELVHEIIRNLPASASLHLANSMTVRYANLIGLNTNQKNVRVFCNRGTSGIDGCSSTTVGHALANDTLQVLITGDLAFFYDRNAFWHNYKLPNLRVIVLNNHGGVIFKMIDGPKELPEADEYFVTHQKLTARNLCEEFGFAYMKYEKRSTLKELLENFFKTDGYTKILEIETSIVGSKEIYNNFKHSIKTNYEL